MKKVCKWKRFRDQEVNEAIWQGLEPVLIQEYPWDENGYRPKVKVRFFILNPGFIFTLHPTKGKFELHIKT